MKVQAVLEHASRVRKYNPIPCSLRYFFSADVCNARHHIKYKPFVHIFCMLSFFADYNSSLQELGLAQHLRSLAPHQGAILALHSGGSSSRTQRVIGIVVVEQIRHADLVKLPDWSASDQVKVAMQPELQCAHASPLQSIQSPKHATLLGVAVMWTHLEHRRKGLARQMISAACTQPEGMFYQFIGCTNKQVAFLAPTDDGTKFAARFRGDGHVLQYNRYEDASESASEALQKD